jgi:hypothetical protein
LRAFLKILFGDKCGSESCFQEAIGVLTGILTAGHSDSKQRKEKIIRQKNEQG